MKEEIETITRRLDMMQGQLLAHQVCLTALGSEMRKSHWAALMELSDLAESRLDELRPTQATDLTLMSYQQAMRDLQSRLHALNLEGPF